MRPTECAADPDALSPPPLRARYTAALCAAAARCHRHAVDEACTGPLPPALLAYLPALDARTDTRGEPAVLRVPAATLVPLADAVPHLLRDDGRHRLGLQLAPLGVTDDATVLELLYATDSPGWSTAAWSEGDAATWLVLGPTAPEALPPDGPARIALPRIEALSDEFAWRLTAADCAGLGAVDPDVRRDTARRLAAWLAHGFDATDVTDALVRAAAVETHEGARRELAAVLSQCAARVPFDVWIRWSADPDPDVHTAAVDALAAHHDAPAFAYFLGRVRRERTARGQRALLRVLARLVGHARPRYEQVLAALADVALEPAAALELARLRGRF